MLKNTPQDKPHVTVVLAHGAGAPMDSGFMEEISRQLCLHSCEVIRFEFPYMQQRRAQGSRLPPNPEAVLLQSWREHLALVRSELPPERKLAIGGKSLGGRMASMIADEVGVDGLVCLGYPFHPVGKPQTLRTEHLALLKIPTLIVQGTRDALGSCAEVQGYTLSTSVQLHWLSDGDHDFKPRVKSGYTQNQHIQTAAASVVEFIHQL